MDAGVSSDTQLVDAFNEYEDLFVAIADTGRSYRALAVLMDSLALRLPAVVDLMGRVHDEQSDSIILPLDAEDELYAGSYFPRRYTGNTLSLEYLEMYDPTATGGTMALVAGIRADSTEALDFLAKLRTHAPGAFQLRSRLYQGCMH